MIDRRGILRRSVTAGGACLAVAAPRGADEFLGPSIRAISPMRDEAKGYLIRQLDTAWKLTDYHLPSLTTDECLWRPATKGLHVRQGPDGKWRADWPDREAYDIGPPSIAWITWHIGFWWSTVLDQSFGSGKLTREEVFWPGTAEGARRWIDELHQRWRDVLEPLSDEDLKSTARTRWPFSHQPFGDVVAWLNVELTKNASEIGYARFLYAVRKN